jgi:glutaredoxin
VLVVTSPGCHFCEDALRLLDELAEATPLQTETVPLSSEQGRELLVRHRAPFPPIVLVDGKLFGYGRISRRKLEAHLTGLMAGARAD